MQMSRAPANHRFKQQEEISVRSSFTLATCILLKLRRAGNWEGACVINENTEVPRHTALVYSHLADF